jgi:putative oxidoreductase
MWRKLIATAPTWMTVPVRLALGIIFIAHGAQKVFGSFGGRGLMAFTGGTAPMGLRPAWFWLGAAAFAELIGGALILVGLATRIGAFLLACVMVVAMFGVHWGTFFLSNEPLPGIEYTVALLGMSLALLIAGGGQASIDQMLMNTRSRRRF